MVFSLQASLSSPLIGGEPSGNKIAHNTVGSHKDAISAPGHLFQINPGGFFRLQSFLRTECFGGFLFLFFA